MKKTEIVIHRSRKLVIRRRNKEGADWAGICADVINEGSSLEAVVFAGAHSVQQLGERKKTHYFEVTKRLRLVFSGSSVATEDHASTRPALKVVPGTVRSDVQPPTDRSEGRLPIAYLPPSSSDASSQSAGGKVIRRQPSELTADGLSVLLALLDAAPERAGGKYLLLQRKLTRFFEGRGCCFSSEDLADETLYRASRRLAEGEKIRSNDPANYFYGVARNVLHEFRASREREFLPLDRLTPCEHPAFIPEALVKRDDERERLLNCLEECLKEMPADHRDLILEYYQADHPIRIKYRKEMAGRLGITPNALKLRIFRIRESLEREVMRRVVELAVA